MKTSRHKLIVAGAGLSALLLASGLLAASAPVVRNSAITGADVQAHVRYLASPALQGRGSGTRGNDMAADYLAANFRAAGLKPAGEGGGYFQTFNVYTGTRVGRANQLFLKGGGKTAALKLRREFMPVEFTKNGYVSAPLVFAGYGISQPELGYDDYKDVDVKGKIVVVLRYTPDDDLNGKFQAFAPLTYKIMTAREKGAAGILFVTGPMSSRPENIPDIQGSGATSDAGIPAAFVRRQFIEDLLAPAHVTLNDLQVAMAHGQPKSFVIPDARAGLKTEVARQTAPTRNVVALLEGSDPKLKDEVIVLGAHYDHLGMGDEHSLEPTRSPKIHHGADDNASGTAGVLEVAQYLAANREKIGRSVLFMGFSGEEIGLLGSNHWTKKPTIPLERVVAMINLDMVGRLRNDACQVIGAATSPDWAELLDSVNKAHGLQLKTSGAANASGFGGSDQQSFYAKDIPVLFFFTGSHKDYHRASDTWDKVNTEGTAKIARFVADTTQKISWKPERPRFARAPEEPRQQTSSGFRVYLGTIPDYAEEVEGVMLQGVREGSPAEKAGVKGGDILVEFDGKKIRNVQEYTVVLGAAVPNKPIKIAVIRKGERVTLDITPAGR